MVALVVGQAQRPGQRGQHLVGGRGPRPCSRPDQVVDRHAGQLRHLLPPQARDPPPGARRQARRRGATAAACDFRRASARAGRSMRPGWRAPADVVGPSVPGSAGPGWTAGEAHAGAMTTTTHRSPSSPGPTRAWASRPPASSAPAAGPCTSAPRDPERGRRRQAGRRGRRRPVRPARRHRRRLGRPPPSDEVARHRWLDVLVNNAGIIGSCRRPSTPGPPTSSPATG